jgi:nitroreductase
MIICDLWKRREQLMETINTILTRRSIRDFKPQAVPNVLVQELLEAAMQAPSAGNQQPWHFIVVTEHNQLDALADALPFGKMLQNAPLGIVACADLKLEKYRGFWVQDCSNATLNLLLAAHDHGLGAVTMV